VQFNYIRRLLEGIRRIVIIVINVNKISFFSSSDKCLEKIITNTKAQHKK